MKLNPIQKAAVSAVLLKDLKEKDALIRSDADSYMLDMNRATGSKTFEVTIEGAGASTEVAIPIATASVAEKTGSWNVDDMEAFTDFMAEAGWADVSYSIEPSAIGAVEQALEEAGILDALIIRTTPRRGWEKMVKNVAGVPVFTETGEQVPGLEYVPGQKYTLIKPKVSAATLTRALGLMGAGEPQALLEEASYGEE